MTSDQFINDSDLAKKLEIIDALDDVGGPVANDYDFVGRNSVVKSMATADTFDDEFLLPFKLQTNEELEVIYVKYLLMQFLLIPINLPECR